MTDSLIYYFLIYLFVWVGTVLVYIIFDTIREYFKSRGRVKDEA